MNERAGKNRKRKSETFTPKRVAVALLILLCFLGAAFFDAWCGVQSRRMGYEIVQARAQQEKLLDLQKKLKIERARLSSPPVLRRYATSELNLETPKPEQIVVMP